MTEKKATKKGLVSSVEPHHGWSVDQCSTTYVNEESRNILRPTWDFSINNDEHTCGIDPAPDCRLFRWHSSSDFPEEPSDEVSHVQSAASWVVTWYTCRRVTRRTRVTAMLLISSGWLCEIKIFHVLMIKTIEMNLKKPCWVEACLARCSSSLG